MRPTLPNEDYDSLVAKTKEASVTARARAARELGRINDARAIGPLLALFGDPSTDVRDTAAVAVASFKAAAMPVLVAAQKRHRSHVRATATLALGFIGDPAARAPLLAALRDTSPLVRAAAATALTDAWDADIILPLLHARADPDRRVRAAAQKALLSYDTGAEPRLAVPLTAALQAEPMEIQVAAACVLAQSGDSAALPVLCAADALTVPHMQYDIVAALAHYSDTQAMAALLLRLGDADKTVRATAARALADYGEGALFPALAALDDAKAVTRSAAARVLDLIGDRRAGDALIAVLDDANPHVRRAAIKALAKLREGRAVEPIALLLLSDVSQYVRQDAARALGVLGDADAAGVLVAALSDSAPTVRRAAAGALGNLKVVETEDALDVAVQDTDKQVKRTATIALFLLRRQKRKSQL